MRNSLAATGPGLRSAVAWRLFNGCTLLLTSLTLCVAASAQTAPDWTAGHVIVNPARHFDESKPLTAMAGLWKAPAPVNRPRRAAESESEEEAARPAMPKIPEAAAAIEQTTQGSGPAPQLVTSFDGMGSGFSGPQGP